MYCFRFIYVQMLGLGFEHEKEAKSAMFLQQMVLKYLINIEDIFLICQLNIERENGAQILNECKNISKLIFKRIHKYTHTHI